MSRTVKDPDERRDEILTTSQRLFYMKGYTKTSIRDIIDSIGIAKGTFYHYFKSKDELLEEMVEKLLQESAQLMIAATSDPEMAAIPKLLQLYRVVGRWKTAERTQIMWIFNALYRDENILLMHKMRRRGVETANPIVSRIIEQGIEEGVFDVEMVEVSAEIFMQTSQAFSESFGYILRHTEQYANPAQAVKDKKAAYEHAMERILGAPKGSLPLFDSALINQWFESN
ncbi:MAG: TetR/AcrR family transcriptional regulator [Candidatus Promineifilaceae bacterium]